MAKMMRSPTKNRLIAALASHPSPTAGEYAYGLIATHYQAMMVKEDGVLADQDPECLHQMRVASRRLSTALKVFDGIVRLPKAAREKHIRRLTNVLGQLRDLDVQIGNLQADYCPRLTASDQKHLNQAIATLEQQRHQAKTAVMTFLAKPEYQQLKDAYDQWLEEPIYTSLAALPLVLLLPALLAPLLSALLLHPAWLLATDNRSRADHRVLHDLRKTCKYVRYQAEFFTQFYEPAFQHWVNELKELQDQLGTVQDACVLKQLLADQLPSHTTVPALHQAIQDHQAIAMMNWDRVRLQYLDAEFRDRLHRMILQPTPQLLNP